MKHIMFVSAGENLELLGISNKSVIWLMALPISEGELQVAILNTFQIIYKIFENQSRLIFLL